MSYTYYGDLEQSLVEQTEAQPSEENTSKPPMLLPEDVDEYYDRAGRYLIAKLCLYTNPCKHTVIDTISGEKMTLGAVRIYEMLEKEGVSHQHFDSYKDYVKINV